MTMAPIPNSPLTMKNILKYREEASQMQVLYQILMTGKFITRDVYKHLRVNSNQEVPWYNLISRHFARPGAIFVLWLAFTRG